MPRIMLNKAFTYFQRGFPLGFLNEGPTDSLCGVKGSLIMSQGFVVLKSTPSKLSQAPPRRY